MEGALIGMADPQTLKVERDGRVATVVLARPDAMNAQTRESRRELIAALKGLARDSGVGAIVLTGEGRAFCAGQDLKEEGALEGVATTLRETYTPIVELLTGMGTPVIAAINGAAAGAGMSFALACDLRVMAEDAILMMAFSNIGLVPDSGGSWLLPRMVGSARAFEIAASGRRLSAAEALELGLVQRVVPREQVVEEAQAWAAELAARPPLALAWTKRMMRESLAGGLADALEREAQMQAAAVATHDHREGVAAFLEKRPPAFEGR